jgi:hypothetical protein
MLNPKIETLNSKQTQMSETQNSKPYDLEEDLVQLSGGQNYLFEFYNLDLFRI